MESCTGSRGRGGGGGRWRLHHVVLVVLLWMTLHTHALGCSSASCNLVLTDAQGEFTSPCYPLKYPNSQACKWTLQAPAGFIIQLSFLDFDLEEAPGCIYDRVVVNTGNVDVRFCGPTANGLTLNSTGNVMELSFTSDFSVQKRGFSVSFRHVAVALRNQKVTISGGNGQVTEVAEAVSIPALSHLTLCFELERSAQKQKEWIFTYTDSSSNVALSLGADQSGVQMIVDGVVCPIDSILPAAEFTFYRKAFCVLWTSSNGRVGVYYNGNYWAKTCSSSSGHSVPGGGNFHLGGQHSFSGNIYNLRLWDHAMSVQQLNALTCDIVGNVVDWDNSHWTIPSTLAQTDTSLSCICYPHCIHLTTAAPTSGVSPPSDTPLTTSCDSPGLGCPASSPATSSTDSTNTIHATNANSNVLPPITPSSSTIPTTSMPLTPTMSPTTATSSSSSTASSFSSSSVMPATTIAITTSAATPSSSATNVASASSTPHAQQTTSSTPTVSSATTNLPATNPTTHVPGTSPPLLLVATNQPTTNIAVTAASSREVLFYRISFVVDDGDSELTRADVDRAVALWLNQTFLNWTHAVYINSSSVQPAVQSGGTRQVKTFLCFGNVLVIVVRPDPVTSLTQHSQQLCFCVCSYACQALLVYYYISNQSLGEAAVSARMSGSEGLMGAGLQVQPGSTDVRSVENCPEENPLHYRWPESRPSITQFLPCFPNKDQSTSRTCVTIDFESERVNPLAQVVLPASLLSSVSLSDVNRSSLSRINFMFFSSTNLFQKEQHGRSLNSYVVASSVGNFSIRDLKEPVEIEIAHLSQQPSLRPVCMFWDFSLNGGAGGWNAEGCRVSEGSSSNRTVCLCDHLTHFGILMDISGASPHIDPRNNKILTFITYIGCGISAIFSAATLLTYIAFEKLRRDYPSKILMNLSTSLLLLNMVFLLDGWLASLDTDWVCLSVAVFLHYFLLTSFTWMGLESVHMYIALVKVFNTYIRRYILKFCIVGWGLPAVLVGIIVSVDKNSYGLQEYGRGESGEGSSEFCWIQNSWVFYITCVGYFCLVFLLNVAMFVVVMLQICGRNGKRSNRTLREEVLRNLRSVISLTFLLGMTWGFALFAWGPVNLAFMYLFSIFNSLQGLFIFIFHCALKENVQKQWRRYLCCGRFRLSDNSDWSKTATNNTKKVSSENLGKSLSSSSFGSSTANWTSKAKATLNPFTKRHSNTDKCYSSPISPKSISSSPSSSEVDPNSSSSSSAILPVSQMIVKVKDYCSTRTDNFYKNIIMSDSFAHSTRF
ncbi:LOW QUALITY PROTEIN: adhesion G-protein coupled receptor G6 [Labrus bergylta]|uniref:LOW QUALITY PROTEIN: adhesion G-protein coupled receptor G6 n=1 Tax=Labrus bergylta TaxID=56723 RepID=UPI003313149D